MKSIYLLCLANLRKNKKRNILIGLILLISALVFSTAVGTLMTLDGLYSKTFNELSTSHELVFFDKDNFAAGEVRKWFADREEVESAAALPQITLRDKVYVNERRIDKAISLVERSPEESKQDQLKVIAGEKKSNPGLREVWIPAGIAYAYDINVDDKITVPTSARPVELKVSAIVADPLFSNNLFDPGRFWVSPGELSTIFSYSNLQETQLGIRYHDPDLAGQVWNDFEDNLGRPFTGVRLKHEMLSNINTIAHQIVGGILLIFSLIIFLAVLFIISNTIKSSILSNYRKIGILKAEGFSSYNLNFVYLMQYFILAAAAVSAGVFLSNFTSRLVLNDIIKALGLGGITISQTLPNLISVLFLLGFILLTTYLAARRTARIKPAQAIRFGRPIKNYPENKIELVSRLKKLPVPLAIGLNNIWTDKKQSLFILLLTMVISFTFLFAVNFSQSLWASLDEGSVWGFGSGEIRVERRQLEVGGLSHDFLLNKLEDHKAVKEVVSVSYMGSTEFIRPDNTTTNVPGRVFGGDLDKMGYKNIRGRHPEENNEIALANNLSKSLDKNIGEKIEVYMEGRKMSFLVTGIYQSYNFGREFRINLSAARAVNPTFEPQEYDLLLAENYNTEEVIDQLDSEVGASVNLRPFREELLELFGNILFYIILAFAALSGMFILLGFLTIYNHSSITVIKREKNHGIFKASGMTAAQIRLSGLFRVIIITLAALILSTLLTLVLAPQLSVLIFNVAGLTYFPFSFNPLYSIGAGLLIILVNGLGAWLASKQVLKLNVRNLIFE